MKICSKCGVGKDSICFTKRIKNSDGLHSWCKECVKNYNINYCKKYYSENKESLLNYSKIYRSENAEKTRIAQEKYRNENRDSLRSKYAESGKKYRLKYPEKAKLKQKKHIENLNDCIINKALKRTGFSENDIKENPELIEIRKIIIKTKRLCKTSKN